MGFALIMGETASESDAVRDGAMGDPGIVARALSYSNSDSGAKSRVRNDPTPPAWDREFSERARAKVTA
jgi:hypothetical protein